MQERNYLKEIDEYFASEALSQSEIKALLKSINVFRAERSKHSKALRVGSAVDVLLLTPSVFDDLFYVMREEYPSDTVVKVIDETHKLMILNELEANEDLSTFKQQIWDALELIPYHDNRKNEDCEDDFRVNKIIREGSAFWKALIKSEGKTQISPEEKANAEEIVLSLQSHPHTIDYFINDEDHIQTLYQVPIYFEHKTVPCRALLDMIIINHKDKTLQPIDLKTMGDSTGMFKTSAKRYRYDIQAAWYNLALRFFRLKETVPYGLGERSLTDYRILPFKFIVESTKYPGCPLVYSCTLQDMIGGRFGFDKEQTIAYTEGERTVVANNYRIEGFEKGVELYKWHMEHDEWEYDRKVIENNGHLPLELWKG
jgi:hypothetical protein